MDLSQKGRGLQSQKSRPRPIKNVLYLWSQESPYQIETSIYWDSNTKSLWLSALYPIKTGAFGYAISRIFC